MITIKGAQSITGELTELTFPSKDTIHLDASGLTIFPGLIDPHVHFRTPGMEHKEDWKTAAQAAIRGGYTTVFDMPNTLPPTITATFFHEKKALIDAQLKQIGIPLRYELYFGADKNHFSEIYQVKQDIVGIKVFMGCSTGNLVIDDDESLHAIFAIAASLNLLVAVHAEDESRMHERKQAYSPTQNYADHSLIRDVEVAVLAVEKAIKLAKIYHTKLYILHVSSSEEINLIKSAKAEGLSVYAETTPHHLFLNDKCYTTLNGKAVVNPPLRAPHHQAIVLEAINTGIIDTIGSDHAPHTEDEKNQPYGQCPSGMPGIETTLPLLLNAYHQSLISLQKILDITYTRPRAIFGLAKNNDVVLVDLKQKKTIVNQDLKTKCHWSAFAGHTLQGWPRYTIVNNQLFDLGKL